MRRITKNNINTNKYWDGVYRSNSYDLSQDEIKFATISNHIENGSSVIEFGCGVGELMDVVSHHKPQCNLFGVDYSADAINTVKAKGYPGTEGDVTNVKKYGEFDYAISLETLEHLDEPGALVENLFTNLKPGGKAILTTPYLDHIPSSEHVWEFNYGDVEAMFKKYFSKVWVFPWASGRCVVLKDGSIGYHCGNWDTIFALGVK